MELFVRRCKEDWLWSPKDDDDDDDIGVDEARLEE